MCENCKYFKLEWMYCVRQGCHVLPEDSCDKQEEDS